MQRMQPKSLILAAFGGLLLLSGGLPARADGVNPNVRFALVSDTHLGKMAPQTLAALVQELNTANVACVFFLGDLVNDGANNAAKYAEWKNIIVALNKPWHAVPGNHDPVEVFTNQVQRVTDQALDISGYRFLLFNNAHPDSHDGFITADQLAWLKTGVEEAAQKKMKVILLAHVAAHENQHPDVGWWVKDQNGGQAFRALLAQYRAVILAFFTGHFHCGLRGWDDPAGVHEVVIPSLCWNTNRRLETAPGWSLDEFRNGYVLVAVYDDVIKLTYKPLGQEPKASKELKIRSGKEIIPGGRPQKDSAP